jgi:hypothetical protein
VLKRRNYPGSGFSPCFANYLTRIIAYRIMGATKDGSIQFLFEEFSFENSFHPEKFP